MSDKHIWDCEEGLLGFSHPSPGTWGEGQNGCRRGDWGPGVCIGSSRAPVFPSGCLLPRGCPESLCLPSCFWFLRFSRFHVPDADLAGSGRPQGFSEPGPWQGTRELGERWRGTAEVCLLCEAEPGILGPYKSRWFVARQPQASERLVPYTSRALCAAWGQYGIPPERRSCLHQASRSAFTTHSSSRSGRSDGRGVGVPPS